MKIVACRIKYYAIIVTFGFGFGIKLYPQNPNTALKYCSLGMNRGRLEVAMPIPHDSSRGNAKFHKRFKRAREISPFVEIVKPDGLPETGD
jgi:hypothetical protein